MNFKLARIAEAGRRNFSIVKLVEFWPVIYLGQDLALVYIITGVHKVGSPCSRDRGDRFRKADIQTCANILVQLGGSGCTAECTSLDPTAPGASKGANCWDSCKTGSWERNES